jgi:signal transduction histidine kinase
MSRTPQATWDRSLVLQAGAGLLLCAGTTIGAILIGGYFWPRWIWFAVATAIAAQLAIRQGLKAARGNRGFAIHAWVTLLLPVVDFAIWELSGRGPYWPIWALLAYTLALAVHAVVWHSRRGQREQALAARVEVLTRTRRGVVDVQAAELRRIERDLHDGTQARMVSLAMNLSLAEQLAAHDPAGTTRLIAEARQSALAALDELRTVMRGIQPPVLSDRGLVGAIDALALDLAVPTTVAAFLYGRPPAAVESAVYLAVAECLANVVKHSHARHAWVTLRHSDGVLSVVTGDDGVGGASVDVGTGLHGVARRLEVFDGTIEVVSPAGGPTDVTVEVPCELSSPKTSSSSGTD